MIEIITNTSNTLSCAYTHILIFKFFLLLVFSTQILPRITTLNKKKVSVKSPPNTLIEVAKQALQDNNSRPKRTEKRRKTS